MGSADKGRLVLKRVLVVDDHPLFRHALRLALEIEFPGCGIVDVSSIDQAVTQLRRIGRFDLALLDLYLPGTTGFEGLLRLRKLFPRLPVVVISGAEDRRLVRDAINYGAAGFVPKTSDNRAIAAALHDVLQGNISLPEDYRHCEADPSARASEHLAQRLASLTRQQFAVLKLLRVGKLNKQIAHELGLSETTVKAHVSEVLRKLGVASRTQAVIEAGRIDFDHFPAPGAG